VVEEEGGGVARCGRAMQGDAGKVLDVFFFFLAVVMFKISQPDERRLDGQGKEKGIVYVSIKW
jgi:hypothetical protein